MAAQLGWCLCFSYCLLDCFLFYLCFIAALCGSLYALFLCQTAGGVSLGVRASPPSIFLMVSRVCVWFPFLNECMCSLLTEWSSSFQWSTVPPVKPWACCQSQHPPVPGSGTHETCTTPPAAGVWFCRASSVRHWQSERPPAPSSSCRRFQASWTLLLVACGWTSQASNRRSLLISWTLVSYSVFESINLCLKVKLKDRYFCTKWIKN